MDTKQTNWLCKILYELCNGYALISLQSAMVNSMCDIFMSLQALFFVMLCAAGNLRDDKRYS